MTEVASIVVFTEHLEQSVAFYRSLGVPLEDEDHGDGFIHAAGEMAGVHVAVLPASAPGIAAGWRGTFVGLWVPSLDEAAAALELLGTEVLRGHEDCEWGCRFVVADPDLVHRDSAVTPAPTEPASLAAAQRQK